MRKIETWIQFVASAIGCIIGTLLAYAILS